MPLLAIPSEPIGSIPRPPRLIEAIRQQPWGWDMVIVTLTGWGQEIDKAQSREAGCDAYLVKPVRLAALESLADRERRGPPAADSKT